MLISRPILLNSLTHKSTKYCMSHTEIDIKIRSSAYMSELKHICLIKQPNLEHSSFPKISFTKRRNKEGERIPPCLTPQEIVKKLENTLTHLTVENNFQYQLCNKRMKNFGNFLSKITQT